MIDIETWIAENPPGDQMYWKSAARSQFEYLLGTLLPLLQDNDPAASMTVVGTHTSKSIALPVVALHSPKRGVTIYARDNFYNWSVTVESAMEIDLGNTLILFNPEEECLSVYFGGFDRAGIPVHGSYAKSKQQYSFQTGQVQFTAVVRCLVEGYSRISLLFTT